LVGRIKVKRILFVAPHRPNRAPSQRFRFEQYLDFLKEKGFECHFSYLISEKDDVVFYSKGKFIRKSGLFFKYFFIRLKDVLKAKKYDIIFIQREAFFLGSAFFERRFSRSKARLIYDFDDSIWLQNVSEANRNLNFLKNYGKTAKIIKYADLIIAGNKYLFDYARNFNVNVEIIPTTIDTNEYIKSNCQGKNNQVICIGWSGSITTIQHFKYAEPILMKIKEKYQEKVCFKVIGDKSYCNEKLEIRGLSWTKQDELKELNTFDIGIMPLPDDVWAKGKCGLKGLQFMSLEIPTIMSPVGVNNEIIIDGENGFLASTEEEWISKLSILIEDVELRKKIGLAGRKAVVEKYSVDAHKNQYVQYFLNLMEIKKA
jgi:glycosyltransferase involved in cell wall biosynthesis